MFADHVHGTEAVHCNHHCVVCVVHGKGMLITHLLCPLNRVVRPIALRNGINAQGEAWAHF